MDMAVSAVPYQTTRMGDGNLDPTILSPSGGIPCDKINQLLFKVISLHDRIFGMIEQHLLYQLYVESSNPDGCQPLRDPPIPSLNGTHPHSYQRPSVRPLWVRVLAVKMEAKELPRRRSAVRAVGWAW